MAGAEHPLLSDRTNIIVIVDEAHRSHYDDLDGYARHLKDALPNATLIAFTGTPISKADHNTREVFGDYIDVYDLSRAVADGATVPVDLRAAADQGVFASGLSEDDIDRAADEASSVLTWPSGERIEKSVAVINAVYGAPDRLKALAADIVEHWERRRTEMAKFIEAPGKAMIVGATRQICADLYAAIVESAAGVALRRVGPGVIKVVYSGVPSDPESIVRHVRRDSANAVIKERLRQVDDPLELVIVKDMMLTGYDSPAAAHPLSRPAAQGRAAHADPGPGEPDVPRQGGRAARRPTRRSSTTSGRRWRSTRRPTRRPSRWAATSMRPWVAVELLAQLGSLAAGYDWRSR
jgi:type I restriction enzyme R subunit